MHAVIVANGELRADARLRSLWEGAELRIAADGGARNARREFALAPDVLIGDFDSLDDELRAWLEQNAVELFKYPRAKDETDLELALNLAFERGADKVTIMGAFGGRIDHFIANIMLLARSPQVVITDTFSEMWVARSSAIIDGQVGDTVSLVPIDVRVEDIVTDGLEYPLCEEDLARGSTRGISNRMIATPAGVRWKKGWMLIMHLFDASAPF